MSDLAKIPAVMIWAATVILIVMLSLILFFAFFHKPICEWLRRAGDLKFSSPKLGAIEVASLPQGSLASTVKATQAVELAAETAAVEIKEGGNMKILDVSDRLSAAFKKRDLEEMAKLRDEFIESGKSDTKKAENVISYLAFCTVSGDSQAREELKKHCSDGSSYAVYARLRYAWALSQMRQPAQDAYREALSAADTDNQKAMAATGLAHEIEESGQWEEATRVLVDALGSISDATERVKLLDALAAIAKQHGQNFLAVIALEESVALNPEDTHNLFELGYCADDAGLPGLSAAAHRQMLVIAPENAGALHNLGVALLNLNLPALAVEQYEQSSRVGNTLADANLAYMLINAGFMSIARERLRAVSNAKDVDEAVYSALARIEEKKKAEDKTLQKVLEQARGLADQLIKFSQSLFSDHAAHKIEGFWSQPGEAPFQLEAVDGNVAGSCNVDKHQWKIAGHTDFAGGGHVDVTQADGYAHPRLKGYMCLESDGSVLRFALHDNKEELTFWRFDRIQPTTA